MPYRFDGIFSVLLAMVELALFLQNKLCAFRDLISVYEKCKQT